MQFLGTGAAELYPNPYCDCAVCRRARSLGEQPRLRSSFSIDKHNLIDLGQDVPAACQLHGISLAEVANVFVTHTHDDHFSIPNIAALTMTDDGNRHFPIRFYISPEGKNWVDRYIEAVRPLYDKPDRNLELLVETGRVLFCPVQPRRPFQAGEMEVVAVRSNHKVRQGEQALNYLFTLPEGTKLFYVCDSGLYSEENLSFLQGAQANLLIMEGTMGSRELRRDDGHLNAAHFVEQVKTFLERGILARDARVYATHINTRNEFTHSEYQAWLDRRSSHKIHVARDGMII